ncbi:SidA/IucD/PvdA family monooxygenase [Kitasatospora sp. NBC_01287]|uniref:lysine N(6)-hydroxylase/L-ornithine N(5)-oxygenase family protein n=1 Tax=Kitasatospora sp. NBC_01287 TaxID=2903573 RepID=UPI00225A2159|nr:SidA/IucD/PvdA family monooxygenase [Kitasatospora sp. NBC_01287]MCX4749980.1 SidA/IucD/PvdA family monooxygenase [Kitasatospora sp. NBC_01287]
MESQDIELLAIGAGPANLALAVALEELAPGDLAERTRIVEQHDSVIWQRGMLLPWTQSQVSFLKDLVTLRNPTSRYSFINYLHSAGRLDEFINLGTFTPYRQEISGYLQWVADTLATVRIDYGRRSTGITPLRGRDGRLRGWRTGFADGSQITSRHLVVGSGRDARIPAEFAQLPAERVIHSAEYSARIAALDPAAKQRFVVIGGAQSAAELLWAVHQGFPAAETTMVMRSIGLKNYESSKFTNEVYYSSFIDDFFASPGPAREQLLREMHLSNYAGLAPGLLETLYRQRYLERLGGEERLKLITMADVVSARFEDGEVVLTLVDRRTGRSSELAADHVLLGTGFEGRMPRLVQGLADQLGLAEVTVTRNYRLVLPGEESGPAVYLQGVNEATHGISDSLLSVLAGRSGEIVQDLLGRRDQPGLLVDAA